jgi:hypothetical protein
VRLTAIELEAGPLVDPPGRHQNIVGPQHDSRITRAPREAKAFVNQPGADAGTARLRFDQEQTQLRNGRRVGVV